MPCIGHQLNLLPLCHAQTSLKTEGASCTESKAPHTLVEWGGGRRLRVLGLWLRRTWRLQECWGQWLAAFLRMFEGLLALPFARPAATAWGRWLNQGGGVQA